MPKSAPKRAPSDIARLQQKILVFRDARDWKQFHNPKDVALSLVLEAAEVLEHLSPPSPPNSRMFCIGCF